MKRKINYSPYAGFIHRVIFSNRCKACMKLIPLRDNLCDECQVEKLRINQETVASRSYTNCNFDRLTSPFYYADEIRECILNLKYRHFKHSADFLADETIKVIDRDFADETPDIITCVPEHKKRLTERQINHASVLTKRIAKAYSVKFYPKLILKTKHTPSQVGLSASERKTNLKGAFKANPKYDLRGKTVLICDDVITTSSTLNECAKALKKAGAERVICATAAYNERNIRKEG